MDSVVKVKMAEYAICQAPTKITTIGLGSCVGIVVYDPVVGICGMLHAMLPDSTRIRNNANQAKFVDTGLEDMLKEMVQRGAKPMRLTAKFAGGARMFDFAADNDITSVGQQNVQMTKKILAQRQIEIVAEDTGENYGRTIVFDPSTNLLEVRAVGQAVKYI